MLNLLALPGYSGGYIVVILGHGHMHFQAYTYLCTLIHPISVTIWPSCGYLVVTLAHGSTHGHKYTHTHTHTHTHVHIVVTSGWSMR